MKLETHIDVTAYNSQEKIADILVKETSLPKPKIKEAMNKGAVWLSSGTLGKGAKRIRRADTKAKVGDGVHLYYDDALLSQQPEPAILISDEGSYSIWHKPYGMLCQGSKWGDHFTINRWVETQTEPHRPAIIVHRLDRAARGLLVLAHKRKTAGYFSKLFESRDIEKRYQAIVTGEFPALLEVTRDVDEKPALTHARLVRYNAAINQSLLDVCIETGRKHQIRKHLSEAGFPIVGDRLYGSSSDCDDSDNDEVDLCLASCYLSFVCPEEQVTKEFHLPEHLKPTL